MTPLLLALLTAAPPLTTVAEESGWLRTGRYEEVERLCAAFPRRYPGKVKCERFGTTPLGRPMLMLVASADGVFTPEQARAKNRPVLLFQGGIHAGEIDGKDAGFWLLREVLDGKVAPKSLNAVTLVFVPVFNIDGHERFGPNHRPNQRGPEETGWRVTSHNLNLNRDYLKADAPEMQAMLTLLHRYEPVMYVDLHVTDGAKFQHDVSVTLEPARLGTPVQQVQGATIKSALQDKLKAQGHAPVFFYPSFDDADDPQSGFSSGWPPPRFAHSYWSANHRFGVLVETHSWKTSKERIKATFDVCAVFLEEATAHAQEWKAAAEAADAAASKLAGTDVVLTVTSSPQGKPLDFLGYAYTRTKSDVSGKWWVQYDESRPETWKVQLRDELVPGLTITAPHAGYVVPPPYASMVAARLALHGLQSKLLTQARAQMSVERMVVEPKFMSPSQEGHSTVRVKGQWTPAVEDLPAGTLFVPIAQPKAELVMHLLEPMSPDSLVSWGAFNAHLEQKEYLEDYLTEAYARELLRDPKVAQEFDAKLKDPAFAKDADARLLFFSRRHPSYDARHNVIPYNRVDLIPSGR
jgi:hypothetical protein